MYVKQTIHSNFFCIIMVNLTFKVREIKERQKTKLQILMIKNCHLI